MNRDSLSAKLRQAQNRDVDLSLLRDALAIDSVTGNEAQFAHFLEKQLSQLDFETDRRKFEADRENVWGVLAGKGSQLMILGHTDTVHVRGWEDHWQDDPRKDPFAGIEDDGHIWSRGACDLKGGICSALAGYRLLKEVGVTPETALTFAFIGDEESGEPGSGVSAGAKDLVQCIKAKEIPTPDFAIYVEPTSLDVYTAQIGFFIADITVTGKTAYFGTPELGIDALKSTHQLLSSIWAHEAQLNAGPQHDLVGSSSILATHIEGGGFIAVPGECKLSIIRKLRPGEELDEAVIAFEIALNQDQLPDGVQVNIEYPAGRDHPNGGSPVENVPDTNAIRLLQDSLRKERPQAGNIGGAPYWSEMPFLTDQIGCPTVYCAPGDIAVAHTYEERLEVEEYLAAVRSFALFIAGYSSTKPTSCQST